MYYIKILQFEDSFKEFIIKGKSNSEKKNSFKVIDFKEVPYQLITMLEPNFKSKGFNKKIINWILIIIQIFLFIIINSVAINIMNLTIFIIEVFGLIAIFIQNTKYHQQ